MHGGDIMAMPSPTRYEDSAGIRRVSGGKDLKNSQYYPMLLGRAVAELFQEHQKEVRKHVADRAQLICIYRTKEVAAL